MSEPIDLFDDPAALDMVFADSGRRRWGRWVYSARTYTLRHARYGYRVHLREMTDSAKMLDWIFQVRGKPEMAADLADLLHALDDLLDVQSSYCPCGRGKTVDPLRLLRDRDRRGR